MKKINIISSVVLLMFFSSCTDYLDETPDNRIEANTLEKASEILVAAYPQGDYFFTDWMTDDSEYIESNQQLTKLTDIFLWKELDELDESNTPTNYWNNAYEAISQANATLDALDKIKSDDIAFRNAIKGEALLCRAYAHFMLANLFSNNYNEATSKTDLGIPYVLESENVLIKQYERNTLFETYTLIEKDLTDGLKLLSNKYYSGSKKYHFTTTAAKAFACRFYMYKGDYTESIKYADMILGVNSVNPVYLKDLAAFSSQSGSTAKRNFFVKNTDPSNILIVEKLVSVGLRSNYGYRTSISVWRNLYWNSNIWDGTDLRDNGYGKYAIETAKFKEEFYKESLTATTGYPFFVQPVFRGEELVFNRIECNIELNNFTAALADFNILGNSRYTGAKTLTIDDIQTYYTTKDEAGNDVLPDEKSALISLLLSEKRKEFLQEGMRWFDIKRHHIAIEHVTSDGDIITLEKDDLRKVLQIPQNATSRGIAKNPR
ncbi:RagB/SusD family nutrient uptake outer membrane protein [Labilibaculum euxinus]